MSDEGLEIRTRPRKAFDLNTPVTIPSSPNLETNGQSPEVKISTDGTSTPARTRSILNLTASTLFGIYRETDYTTEREESSTPWGTGSETPVGGRKRSIDLLRASIPEAFSQNKPESKVKRKTPTKKRSHKSTITHIASVLSTTLALFIVGVLYGAMIGHLHDRGDIVPVPVDGINHDSWQYLVFWGFAGVALGNALPAVDAFWSASDDGRVNTAPSRLSNSWLDAIRGIGAFVGIAFAIRKTSWASTLQLSLTLACTNPALWWLIDRSMPGFLVSTAVAFGGTGILLLTNPDVLPAPATKLPSHVVKRMGRNATLEPEQLVFGLWDENLVGSVTWIASVLFVSAVCFGNVGRRLAELRK